MTERNNKAESERVSTGLLGGRREAVPPPKERVSSSSLAAILKGRDTDKKLKRKKHVSSGKQGKKQILVKVQEPCHRPRQTLSSRDGNMFRTEKMSQRLGFKGKVLIDSREYGWIQKGKCNKGEKAFL